jgi:hypothetical protein
VLADEWQTLRELLAAERVAIAALETHLTAGSFARSSSATVDADQLASEATQLSVLMEDLVRREAELELARHELTRAQQAGPGATPLPIEQAGLDELRRQNEERRQQVAAEADRLAVTRAALDREAATLAATRDKLTQSEAELARQQQQLVAGRAALQVEQLERESREAQSTRDRQRIEAERRQLDADLDRLAAAEAAARIEAERIEHGKQQLARQTERYEQQRALLETERSKLAQERTDLALAQEAARACQAEFTRAHERLELDRQQVSLERDRLVALESDTKNQRRRIAREFRVQHATHLTELESRREELVSLVSTTESELRTLAAATDSERQEELAVVQQEERELRERVAQLGKLLNARADELRQLREQAAKLTSERDELRDQLAHAWQHGGAPPDAAAVEALTAARAAETAQLRADRDQLAERLSTAQEHLTNAQERLEAGNSPDDSARRQELQRRFEMAVQDLREQKERNVLLENRLACKTAGVPPALGVGGDWESQKRHLLESLAAVEEDEEEDSEAAERRLSLEATIAITDEVVAQKDREIAELRQLLEDQAGNIGSIAVGATAIAGILDQDELIAQERARLAQIQAEWREKLRQAEIDISVQRATIARDRAQIDEKLANHQFDLDRMKAVGPTAPGAKPSRRWLSRLGLKESEE